MAAVVSRVVKEVAQEPTSSLVLCPTSPAATKAFSTLVLSNLILSFLPPGKASARAAETCRAWRYLARKSLSSNEFFKIFRTSSEELFMGSSTTRKEDIQAKQLVRLKALSQFPNLTILNLKDLRALYRSEDICTLLMNCLRINVVILPEQFQGHSKQQENAMAEIVKRLPPRLTGLDIRPIDPRNFSSFAVLDKCNLPNLRWLGVSAFSSIYRPIAAHFPLLETLEVNEPVSLVELFTQLPHLSKLRIQGVFKSVDFEALVGPFRIAELDKLKPPKSLKHVVLINCRITDRIKQIFKGSTTLQMLELIDCPVQSRLNLRLGKNALDSI